MIGVIVATHSELGAGLVKTSEILLGKKENLKVIKLDVGDSIQQFSEQLEKDIITLNGDDGVIVLVDMIGGSPYNVAFSLLQKHAFQLIAGINLPVFLHILTTREEAADVQLLADNSVASGKESITVMNQDVIKKLQKNTEG